MGVIRKRQSEWISYYASRMDVGDDGHSEPKRAAGRPLRGLSPARVVPVRMTTEEIAGLKLMAEMAECSVSELIRRAVAAYGG